MSDSLNALLQNQRSSSVLQGIANPPQVNPLADIQAGNQVAQQIFQTRQAQMNNASQFSGILAAHAMTVMKDPSDANINATFDNLAASGMPQAQIEQERQRWLGMSQDQRSDNAYRIGLVHLDQMHQVLGQTTLLNTGGQILPATTTQPGVRTPGGLAIGPGAASTTLSPSDYVSGGYHTQATQADVDAGMKGQDGQPVHIGQDIYIPGAVINQRTGLPAPPGLGPPGGTGGGGGGGGPAVVRGSDGKPVSPANPPRLLNVPGQTPPATTPSPTTPLPVPPVPPAVVPPSPPIAPPTGTTGNGPTATAPAVTSPPVTSPPVTSPPVTSAFPRGAALTNGGVQVASANPLQVPNTGPPGPPNPLVPGDVADIQAGMANARANPVVPGTTQTAWNTIASGPGTEEAQGNKASADKLAADRLEATNFQSTQFPYVQALKNYGEGTKTGPTTDFWNQVAGTIRTPLAKLGMNIGPLSDTTERVDALGKWLANIQTSNPISAKSDAELAQVLKGSASTHINEAAGEDQVKAGLALQRMKVAATNEFTNNPAMQRQYGTYLNYLQNFNNTIDPRAFALDMYNPAQIARLRTQLQNGSEADAKRFQSTLDLARRNGMVGGAGSQAMP